MRINPDGLCAKVVYRSLCSTCGGLCLEVRVGDNLKVNQVVVAERGGHVYDKCHISLTTDELHY